MRQANGRKSQGFVEKLVGFDLSNYIWSFHGRKFALIDQTQFSPVLMICNKLVHFANVFFGVSTGGVHIDQTPGLLCSNMSQQAGTIFPVWFSFLNWSAFGNVLWLKSVPKCVFLVQLPWEGRGLTSDGFHLSQFSILHISNHILAFSGHGIMCQICATCKHWFETYTHKYWFLPSG